MASTKPQYTTKQLADNLGINVGTLYRRWRADPDNRPDPVKTDGRTNYYSESQLKLLRRIYETPAKGVTK